MATMMTQKWRNARRILCSATLVWTLSVFAEAAHSQSRQFESSTELPVSLYNVEIGTEKMLEFNLPDGTQGAVEAKLELLVDDIDEAAEALLFVNEHGPIAWPASILGEGKHLGAVPIPLDMLKRGKNVFTFVFADDLRESTMGFVVLKAGLRLYSHKRAVRKERAAAAREAYRNEILGTEGLISYWPLDEIKGTTARDIVGKRNALLRKCTTGRTGVAGECVEFDGAKSVMLVDAELLAAALNGAGGITLELWIVPDSAPEDTQGIVTLRGRQDYGSTITRQKSSVSGSIRTEKESVEAVSGTIPDYSHRRFSHVVLVGDFEKGTLVFYIDGVRAGGTSRPGYANTRAVYGGTATDATTFGAANINCAGAFAGLIDEIAIYRRPLDPETIEKHHELGRHSAATAEAARSKLTAGDIPGWRLSESNISCRAIETPKYPWPTIWDFCPANIVELADGTWITNRAQRSKDRGRSWTKDQALGSSGRNGEGLLRLTNGELGMYYSQGWDLATAVGNGSSVYYFRWSSDEGETWSEPVRITLPGAMAGLAGEMFTMKDGRLVLTTYSQFLPRLGLWGGSYGTYKGHRIKTESEGHFGCMEVVRVYYSDDFGRSWQTCDGWIMGFRADAKERWTDSFTEPTCIELNDGSLFMMGRTLVGRAYAARSSDRGHTWGYAYPTELVASYSPGRLVRLPQTGDLVYIWNQISREENNRGLRRSRLSSAVSKDGGKTWGHFKNIAAIKSLADTTRVPVDPSLTPRWGDDEIGELPEDFKMWHYPTATVMGEELFLGVAVTWFGIGKTEYGEEEVIWRGAALTWIIPVNWFYE